METFAWDKRPAYFVTKTILKHLGMKPGKGQWPIARVGTKMHYELFDIRDAEAKRTQTDEQREECAELVMLANLERPRIKKRATADDVVYLLNEMLLLDRTAVEELMAHRVFCNPALAEHPTIPIRAESAESHSVGLLGVLNGLFGVDADGYGAICAVFRGDELLNFRRMEDSLKGGGS